MGTTFSRIWDVVYLVPSFNLVASERKHVHSKDHGVRVLIMSHRGDPDSLENSLGNLVFGVTFFFRKLFM